MTGSKYTPAQKKASDTYQKKLASISIKLKPELATVYKNAAQKLEIPLREFILSSMNEKIARDINGKAE